MGFVPTTDGARIVINWVKGTETFSYVFYATKAGYDLTALQALAAGVDAVHNATVKSYFGNQVTYNNTTCYDARTLDGPMVANVDHTGAGTNAQETLPLNLCVCVTMRTAGRGRSSRGRKYITGFTEGNIQQGVWQGSCTANALLYVTNIHNAIATAGWSHVIRSIQENGVELTTANVRAVTSMTVRSAMVATQRRRVDRP